MQFSISIEFFWYFLDNKHRIHAIHSAPPVYGDVLPSLPPPKKKKKKSLFFGCFFFSFSTFLTGLTLHLTEAAGNPKCIPKLLETAMIAEVQMRKDGVNFSLAPVKLFSKASALNEHPATAEAALSPLQTRLHLTCRAEPKSCFFIHSHSFSEIRCHRETSRCWEWGGSLISRNVTKNKENFPACVYIKANIKRVCSLGAHPSSAAAGLSGGTQHGFMASLQWDSWIQTYTHHWCPDMLLC